MMEELFLTVLEISVSVGAAALLLFLLSPLLGRRYGAGWSYLFLTLLALRLVILYNWNPTNVMWAIKIPLITSNTVQSTMKTGNLPQLSAGEAAWRISPWTAVFGIWLLGAALVLLLHLFSYLHYRRKLIKGAEQLSDIEVLKQFETLQEELKVHRKISLLQSGEIASPMVLGFRQPLLVLPRRVYTERELYFILRHELVHLKRGDLYARLLFVAAEAVHWFNPLVWLLQRQAVFVMELACDEQVVRGMDYQERKSYTKVLLSSMSGQNKSKIALSTHFSGGTEIMKKRFQNILEKKNKKNGLPFLCLSCVVVLVLGSLVACQAKESEAPAEGTVGFEQQAISEPSSYQGAEGEPMDTETYFPDEIESHVDIEEVEHQDAEGAEQTNSDEEYAQYQDGLLGTEDIFEEQSDADDTLTHFVGGVQRGPDGQIKWIISNPVDIGTGEAAFTPEELEAAIEAAIQKQLEELEAQLERERAAAELRIQEQEKSKSN